MVFEDEVPDSHCGSRLGHRLRARVGTRHPAQRHEAEIQNSTIGFQSSQLISTKAVFLKGDKSDSLVGRPRRGHALGWAPVGLVRLIAHLHVKLVRRRVRLDEIVQRPPAR